MRCVQRWKSLKGEKWEYSQQQDEFSENISFVAKCVKSGDTRQKGNIFINASQPNICQYRQGTLLLLRLPSWNIDFKPLFSCTIIPLYSLLSLSNLISHLSTTLQHHHLLYHWHESLTSTPYYLFHSVISTSSFFSSHSSLNSLYFTPSRCLIFSLSTLAFFETSLIRRNWSVWSNKIGYADIWIGTSNFEFEEKLLGKFATCKRHR